MQKPKKTVLNAFVSIYFAKVNIYMAISTLSFDQVESGKYFDYALKICPAFPTNA
jgi:hypothetical protein